MHEQDAFELLAGTVGRDHLLYGTNFGGWDSGVATHIDLAPLQQTLDANARRLLRLR